MAEASALSASDVPASLPQAGCLPTCGVHPKASSGRLLPIDAYHHVRGNTRIRSASVGAHNRRASSSTKAGPYAHFGS